MTAECVLVCLQDLCPFQSVGVEKRKPAQMKVARVSSLALTAGSLDAAWKHEGLKIKEGEKEGKLMCL